MSEFKYKDKNGQVYMILDNRLFFRWDSRWVPAAESIEILPTAIELNEETASVAVGKTEQLTATITPSSTTVKTLVWASSKESVATVTDEGLVTAVKAGKATITCTCASDPTVKAECKITVS